MFLKKKLVVVKSEKMKLLNLEWCAQNQYLQIKMHPAIKTCKI